MESLYRDRNNPHQGQPLLQAGEPLDGAKAAMVMVHGRGATAEDILTLTSEFTQSGFTYLAPQAAANTWYPKRFLAQIPENEPWLTSALGVLAAIRERLAEAGFSPERTIWLGFSQGACLALQFAAPHPPRVARPLRPSRGFICP